MKYDDNAKLRAFAERVAYRAMPNATVVLTSQRRTIAKRRGALAALILDALYESKRRGSQGALLTQVTTKKLGWLIQADFDYSNPTVTVAKMMVQITGR